MRKLHANAGDTVSAGQIIATVDSTDVAQARSAYSQALAASRLAEKKLDNTRRLAKAGVYSHKPLDEVRRERAQVASEYASLQVQQTEELASAEAAVRTAEAAVARVQSERKLTTAELERRRQLASVGAYQYKPLEDAQTELASARADQIAAESAQTVAQSQLARAKRLFEIGTASKRELVPCL